MAGAKVAALMAALAICVLPAAAAEFNVQVADNAEYTQNTFKHSYQDKILNLNASIENSGSIGCEYRVRTEFSREDVTEERWSAGHALWPGSSDLMSINYLPYNYTGPVNASVELHYCGQQDEIGNFNLNVSERAVTNETVPSTTRESNVSSAVVEVEVEEGKMVPKTAPTGWKPSTVRIEEGEAELRYDPYIFQQSQNLTYTVVDGEGNVVGTSKVSLEPEVGIVSTLRDYAVEILLGLSLLFNLLLIVNRKVEFSDYLNL